MTLRTLILTNGVQTVQRILLIATQSVSHCLAGQPKMAEEGDAGIAAHGFETGVEGSRAAAVTHQYQSP
jgi:hypothetical protein